MTRRLPEQTRDTARKLRGSATRAEYVLWQRLRQSQLGGHKFTRQYPVGPYFADFCCREQGLVVEVDGGQHDVGKSADDRRTAAIQVHGFRVLRFWNNEVLDNMDGVLTRISEALGEKDSVAVHKTRPTP